MTDYNIDKDNIDIDVSATTPETDETDNVEDNAKTIAALADLFHRYWHHATLSFSICKSRCL
jgi:hypothetical protein